MSKCGCLHKFEGGPSQSAGDSEFLGDAALANAFFGFVSTVCSNAMWPYRRYYCTLLAWAGDAISDPFVFDLVCFFVFQLNVLKTTRVMNSARKVLACPVFSPHDPILQAVVFLNFWRHTRPF